MQTLGPSGTPVPTRATSCLFTNYKRLSIQFFSKQLSTQRNELSCLRTQSLSRQADSSLYTREPWLCTISKQQRKTKIVLWKCSIIFGKNLGRKNVGTGVPDGPSLLCLLPCLQIPPNAWSVLSTKLQKVRACTESFCPHGGCWGMWHPSYV